MLDRNLRQEIHPYFIVRWRHTLSLRMHTLYIDSHLFPFLYWHFWPV